MIPTRYTQLLLNAALLVLIGETSKEIASIEAYLANLTNSDNATEATMDPTGSNNVRTLVLDGFSILILFSHPLVVESD